jgi:hypothetical protein
VAFGPPGETLIQGAASDPREALLRAGSRERAAQYGGNEFGEDLVG